MNIEKELVEYIVNTKFDDLPAEPIDTIKTWMLRTTGTTIGGATTEGIESIVSQVREWGGREEATILIHGGKVTAHNAAFVNSVMARALDWIDGRGSGLHVGASAFPTALATAELIGGCSGKEFLAAIVAGAEIAYRINAAPGFLNFDDGALGHDPSGTCAIFATTAIAGKMLHLNSAQMWNALGLALNRCAGSYQSNIDGALAVRVLQGFSSKEGIICAQLAQRGITGPMNFLEGTFGYYHLYAQDKYDPQAPPEEHITGELGKRFEVTLTRFKKYPCCGLPHCAIEIILELVEEKGITPENVARIDVRVPSALHTFPIAGPRFKLGALGTTPSVRAQFNISYGVANALLRKSCKIEHYQQESYVTDPKIMEIVDKTNVIPDPALDKYWTFTDVEVKTKDGHVYRKSKERASWYKPGRGGTYLTKEDHLAMFQDCVSYASKFGKPLPQKNMEEVVSKISRLEEIEDVRSFIPLLLS